MDKSKALEIIVLLLNRAPINVAENHAAQEAIKFYQEQLVVKEVPAKPTNVVDADVVPME